MKAFRLTKSLVALLLSLVTILTSLNTRAEPAPEFQLDHVALSVADVDASAEFYHNILGLEEINNRTQIAGIRWFRFFDGRELHLISLLNDEVKVNKAVHFALTATNFDAFIDRLDANGIVYSDWPGEEGRINQRADGVQQVFIQDPDGYWIEVNSAR
ncbi:VOC family protein [Umboniibacter marinipuniceus]|uniref:Catechol 2,3-dioxygenase-like lactoylglutathione lyase family enzyme n=1 Tax=Umboniibacter marinipuniceus TaxID=569599 RepID=A0A3M0AJ72_9GAMM|nr:VOC family protein [Umboniibacter marinipuniceus]RMA82615.1 catechol 2,3-dioxygenase-like lactoylglutathione lyase family enzyme [Umboniibacter marinipuniceus]